MVLKLANWLLYIETKINNQYILLEELTKMNMENTEEFFYQVSLLKEYIDSETEFVDELSPSILEKIIEEINKMNIDNIYILKRATDILDSAYIDSMDSDDPTNNDMPDDFLGYYEEDEKDLYDSIDLIECDIWIEALRKTKNTILNTSCSDKEDIQLKINLIKLFNVKKISILSSLEMLEKISLENNFNLDTMEIKYDSDIDYTSIYYNLALELILELRDANFNMNNSTELLDLLFSINRLDILLEKIDLNRIIKLREFLSVLDNNFKKSNAYKLCLTRIENKART